jgi:hypothetical protein
MIQSSRTTTTRTRARFMEKPVGPGAVVECGSSRRNQAGSKGIKPNQSEKKRSRQRVGDGEEPSGVKREEVNGVGAVEDENEEKEEEGEAEGV